GGSGDGERALLHFSLLQACERRGWTASPTRAATRTITGSGTFLNRHSTSAVAIARPAVIQSVIERCAITIAAPVMAPIAAAVTPSTKARMAGRWPWRLKYGAGRMVRR